MFMSDETKDKEPSSFAHLGGKKIGHPVPTKAEKPLDFSSIGGRCVRKPSEHPTFSAKPESIATIRTAR